MFNTFEIQNGILLTSSEVWEIGTVAMSQVREQGVDQAKECETCPRTPFTCKVLCACTLSW